MKHDFKNMLTVFVPISSWIPPKDWESTEEEIGGIKVTEQQFDIIDELELVLPSGSKVAHEAVLQAASFNAGAENVCSDNQAHVSVQSFGVEERWMAEWNSPAEEHCLDH